MKKEPLFISKIEVYETPSDEAQAKFSVGMAVANRLNGDGDLVGTFDPDDDEERMIGFLTFREKFNDEDEAKEYRQRMMQKYRVGTTLSSKWTWGQIDEMATRHQEGNAIVHMVKFMNKEIPTPKEVIRAEQEEKLEFKGKVTEPV